MSKLTKDQLKEQAKALGLSFNTKITVAELEKMITDGANSTSTNETVNQAGEY